MSDDVVTAIWNEIASGKWRKPTSGLAGGFVQANVVILPQSHAFDFLLYCYRNEQACPVIDVTDPGMTEPPVVAKGADIRVHVPKYRIYRKGQLAQEVDDIVDWFQNDMVTFLLGCSFTFEKALLREGVPVRHVELGRNVPMYVTSLPTRPAGIFSGPLVVSMRPMPEVDARRAVEITRPFRKAHGAPVHVGDPAAIGIHRLDRVDFGDAPVMREGEVPVFWACGVTPQMALRQAQPALAITHSPGHMLITRISEKTLESW